MASERYWISYMGDAMEQVTEVLNTHEAWDKRAAYLLDIGFSIDQWIA